MVRTFGRQPSSIVIGIGTSVTHASPKSFSGILKIWNRFLSNSVATSIPGVIDSKHVYAIYHSYTDTASYTSVAYRFTIGMAVIPGTTVPADMESVQLNEGTYAHFSVGGPTHETIPALWQHIWHTASLERTFTTDYEVYELQTLQSEKTIVNVFVSTRDSQGYRRS